MSRYWPTPPGLAGDVGAHHGDVSRHAGGDLAAALGRSTATTVVVPISEDMVFPVRDCAAEQALTPRSELAVVDDVLGHLGLFGVAPTYIGQVDAHLGALLATEARPAALALAGNGGAATT